MAGIPVVAILVMLRTAEGYAYPVHSLNEASIIAYDDFTEVSEDISVRILVLRNDEVSDQQLDSSTLKIVRLPKSGVAVVNGTEGTITYTPNPDFFGLDTFWYQVCTKDQVCAGANVFIKVHPVNDRPVAHPDEVILQEDELVVIDAMINDSDSVDQTILDSLRLHLIKQGNFGRTKLVGRGIQYEPAPNYFGNDAIYYSICDETLCDTAMIRIIVTPVNDKPIANDDYETTYRDLLVVMDLIANDVDTIDFSELDYRTIATKDLLQPRNGYTFVDTTVGLLLYIPDDKYLGFDTFQYRVCDYGPGIPLCDTAYVYINIVEAPFVYEVSSLKQTQVSYKVHREYLINDMSRILERNTPETVGSLLSEKLSKEIRQIPGKYPFIIDPQGALQIFGPRD